MPKKKYYLILDTETATLPFVNDLAKEESAKKRVAIAKPLVYDLGWVVMDRKGKIIKTVNFLIQETFFVPQVFSTAYYKDKRPQYIKLLNEGKIKVADWVTAISELWRDLCTVNLAAAYNACFDFKKAIPFTCDYISALYSERYNDWEKEQRKNCQAIIKGKKGAKNEDYLKPEFHLWSGYFPIVDLWGIACKRLINNNKYRDYCLKNSLLSESAQYFKTSAETAFQYLMREYDFVESHTALDDALIEAQILAKALKKGKVEPQIDAFPFRALGTTFDYINKYPKYAEVVANILGQYINKNANKDKIESSRYWKGMINRYLSLTGQNI